MLEIDLTVLIDLSCSYFILIYSFEVVDRTDEVSSKHGFEVVDETDEVSSKHGFEVVDETDEVSSKHSFEVVDETDEVSNHIYGKATLTKFELDFRRV
ncbi:chlorohydrolase [Streptococcus pneumoniae]|nr:chlorohydrolase [Streptococcus pneumoniae]